MPVVMTIAFFGMLYYGLLGAIPASIFNELLGLEELHAWACSFGFMTLVLVLGVVVSKVVSWRRRVKNG